MSMAAQKAILKAFRQAGIEAGEALSRAQLVSGFLHHHRDIDALDTGIDELVDTQFLETDDDRGGPYVLTDDGYQASLNFQE